MRLKIVGRLIVDGAAGADAVTLTGRLPDGKRLRPGAYVLIARITDAAGSVGVQKTARFVLTEQEPAGSWRGRAAGSGSL